MKKLLPLLMVLTLSVLPAAAGETPVLKLDFPKHDWPEPVSATDPRPVMSQKASGERCEILRLTDRVSESVTLWETDNPPVGHDAFAVEGNVAHRGIGSGKATLFMTVDFPDGTRDVLQATVGAGTSGPRNVQLEGTAAAHKFRFTYPGQPDAVPARLRLLLSFYGTGVVSVADAKLVRITPDAPATAAAGPETLTMAMDRVVAAYGPASQPTGGSLAAAGPIALADLPPAVAVAVRTQMESELVEAIDRRRYYVNETDDAASTHGANSPEARQRNETIAAFDRQITALRAALAQPMPASATAVDPPGLVVTPWPYGPFGRAMWVLSFHPAAFALSLVGLSVAAMLWTRHLAVRGRGRSVATGVVGLILAGGVTQIFAAGVAIGMSLPPVTWRTLLASAAMTMLVPAVTLPRVRQQYADAELRRMRAMDVPA